MDSIDNHVFSITVKITKRRFPSGSNTEKVMRTAHCSANGLGEYSQNFTGIFPKIKFRRHLEIALFPYILVVQGGETSA